MNVQQILVTLTKRLVAAGIPEPRLEAELLVRHVLMINRSDIYASPEREIGPEQIENLDSLLGRRSLREPLPYILGEWRFYDLPFYVNPSVLVPRPETEILVDKALSWAYSHRRRSEERVQIADVGTGSGCVAVSLAIHMPKAKLFGLDNSPKSLEVARANCRRHEVGKRVRLIKSHLLESLPAPVDLIVANLPYVPDKRMKHLEPEVNLYEPSSALRGGIDGTALIRELLKTAGPFLRPAGALILEFDSDQRSTLERISRKYFPQAETLVFSDLAGLDRVLIVQLPS